MLNDRFFVFVPTEYNLDVRTGSCYKFHRRGLIWPQAYMTCMAEGGHLAIINNELEAKVLSELLTKTLDKLIFSKNRHIASIGFLEWGDGGSWMTIHGEYWYVKKSCLPSD